MLMRIYTYQQIGIAGKVLCYFWCNAAEQATKAE